MHRSPQRVAGGRRSGRLLVLALLGAASLGAGRRLAADPQGPTPQDRYVTRIVASLLRSDHLSRRALDDKISEGGLDAFLETLDRRKLYFNQSDVDEFMKRRDDLDDMAAAGDIRFAYTVFDRYLKRVDERMALVDKLLKQDFDFTRDEQFVTDPDLLHYPRNQAEARDRWRKRIKLDLLMLKTDKLEGEEARKKLTRRYHSFAKRMHQTDSDELLEMFLNSLTASYDPHTSYMSPSSLKNFRIMMSLELQGIGAALQFSDGYTVVAKVIPGGAADKEGELKTGDRIVGVGQGEDGEMEDVVDMKLGDVVKLIRGRARSVVRLGVISEGGTETKIITITRAKIELTDSEARSEVLTFPDEGDAAPIRIGFIDLPSFYMDMEGARTGKSGYKSTTRDVRRILENFRKKEVDVVILDLRRNGGGSLTEAINVTGLFIDYGPVVQVKDSAGAIQEYRDRDTPGMIWDGPLVVLTSKFSASASEIFAGAIQDYRRGLIVGDATTHGKGTVQSLLDLGSRLFRIPDPPNMGALKITMQQFYRPDGDSTQKRGVAADVVLPSITSNMDVGEADLDSAIDFDKIRPADYIRYNMVSADMVAQLSARSAQRIAKSEKFADLRERIKQYLEQKERKSVSLNEKKFFAQREKLDVDKEEEKQFEEQNNPDDEVVHRDFYVDEVLAVTHDYVKMLSNGKIVQSK